MTKIVINGCYGGFSLSEEAVTWLKNKYPESEWEAYMDYCRHDPRLVEVVEALEGPAGGRFAELGVVDIGDEQKYRICEYDGLEWVETPNTITDWVTV